MKNYLEMRLGGEPERMSDDSWSDVVRAIPEKRADVC